jgi:hypothetical protein
MNTIPSAELAVKINKILNRNKHLLKQFQDRHGKLNFNLLVGSVLGAICSFAEKPMLNQVISTYFPVFNEKQLGDYANFMMGLNNYLVYTFDSNRNDIYLLENNKWTLITEASVDSVYAIWYAFFGIMKTEFEESKVKIDKLKNHAIVFEALKCYDIMSKIMTSQLIDANDINIMQNEFPKFAYKFNELRKLMFMQTVASQPTLH